MDIELPEGYFISARTGNILRKKSAPKTEIGEQLKLANNPKPISDPIIEPVEPEPVIVSIEELIKHNTLNYDVDNAPNHFLTVMQNIMSAGSFSNCCGVGERGLLSISAVSINATTESIIDFGCFFYCIMEHAWNMQCVQYAATSNGIATLQKRLKNHARLDTIRNYYTLAAYVFTYAAHQNIQYKEFFKMMGATEVHVGYNPRYNYAEGNHDIYIYILDRINSMPRFFEQHRKYLTKKYLTNNQK